MRSDGRGFRYRRGRRGLEGLRLFVIFFYVLYGSVEIGFFSSMRFVVGRFFFF